MEDTKIVRVGGLNIDINITQSKTEPKFDICRVYMVHPLLKELCKQDIYMNKIKLLYHLKCH